MHRPTLSLFALMGLLGGGLLATSTVCGQVPSFGDHCGGIIPFVDDDPWFPYALPTATRSDAHRITERSSSWRFYASGCDPIYDEAVYGTQKEEVAVSLDSQEEVAKQVVDQGRVGPTESDDEYVDFPYELTYDDDPPVASDDHASEQEPTTTVEGEIQADETGNSDTLNDDKDPYPYGEGYEAYDDEYEGEYDYEYEYGGEDTDDYDDEADYAYDDEYDYEYDYEYDGYEEYNESDEPRDHQYSVDDDYEYGSVEDGHGIADADEVTPTPVDDAAEAYRYYGADDQGAASSNDETADGSEEAYDGDWEDDYDYEYQEEYDESFNGGYDEDYEYEGAYEYDGDAGAAPADLSSKAEDSDDEYEDFPYELTYDDMPTQAATAGMQAEELMCLLSDARERVACWLREVRMEESAQRAALVAQATISQLAATLPRVLEEMASHGSSDVVEAQAAATRPSVARPVGATDGGHAATVSRKARREARLRLALLLDRVGESLQRVSRQMMLELAREDSDRLVR